MGHWNCVPWVLNIPMQNDLNMICVSNFTPEFVRKNVHEVAEQTNLNGVLNIRRVFYTDFS